MPGEPGALLEFLGFTARPFDAFTGLQNNLNRWYDAAVGRWLSEDPIGFDGGDVNLYRYVGNDPLRFADPLGIAPPEVGDRQIRIKSLGQPDIRIIFENSLSQYKAGYDGFDIEIGDVQEPDWLINEAGEIAEKLGEMALKTLLKGPGGGPLLMRLKNVLATKDLTKFCIPEFRIDIEYDNVVVEMREYVDPGILAWLPLYPDEPYWSGWDSQMLDPILIKNVAYKKYKKEGGMGLLDLKQANAVRLITRIWTGGWGQNLSGPMAVGAGRSGCTVLHNSGSFGAGRRGGPEHPDSGFMSCVSA